MVLSVNALSRIYVSVFDEGKDIHRSLALLLKFEGNLAKLTAILQLKLQNAKKDGGEQHCENEKNCKFIRQKTEGTSLWKFDVITIYVPLPLLAASTRQRWPEKRIFCAQ